MFIATAREKARHYRADMTDTALNAFNGEHEQSILDRARSFGRAAQFQVRRGVDKGNSPGSLFAAR